MMKESTDVSLEEGLPGTSRRRTLLRVLVVILLPFIAHRALIAAGLIPDTKLNTGEELGGHVRRTIERELEPGEEVLWFYSEDWLDAGDHGSLLTDRRLVGWATSLLDFTRYKTDLRDVEAVRVKFGSGFLWETEVLAWTHGWGEDGTVRGWGTYVGIPSRGSRDLIFVRDLVQRARAAGANIVVVELGGDVTDAEIAQVPGATRGVVNDIRNPPSRPEK